MHQTCSRLVLPSAVAQRGPGPGSLSSAPDRTPHPTQPFTSHLTRAWVWTQPLRDDVINCIVPPEELPAMWPRSATCVPVRVSSCEGAGWGWGSSPLAGTPTDTPGSVPTPLRRPAAQGNDELFAGSGHPSQGEQYWHWLPRRQVEPALDLGAGGKGVDPILPTSQAKAVDKGRSQSDLWLKLSPLLKSQARENRSHSPEARQGGGSCPLALQRDAHRTRASLLPRWAHAPL